MPPFNFNQCSTLLAFPFAHPSIWGGYNAFGIGNASWFVIACWCFSLHGLLLDEPLSHRMNSISPVPMLCEYCHSGVSRQNERSMNAPGYSLKTASFKPQSPICQFVDVVSAISPIVVFWERLCLRKYNCFNGLSKMLHCCQRLHPKRT